MCRTAKNTKTFSAQKSGVLEWDLFEPQSEINIEIAFPESDDIDGALFLDVSTLDSLENIFEDIYNQLRIEYEEWDYFVGTKESISPNLYVKTVFAKTVSFKRFPENPTKILNQTATPRS